jgi:hypothetical protein
VRRRAPAHARTRRCAPTWTRSDDVDDQFTEQGRVLIRREGEALAAGLAIGAILTAGDVELPGGVRRRKAQTAGASRVARRASRVACGCGHVQ